MIDSNAEPNIYNNDFLVWSTQTKDKFDVIMGNPPYNKNTVNTGGGTFWIIFVNKSLDLLHNYGFLTFVHPPGWRKPVSVFKDKTGKPRDSAGDILQLFLKSGIIKYINIDNESNKKWNNFPIVDYYLFKKINNLENQKKKILKQLLILIII